MSNRSDFLDEREQEAINNPLDFQQPEEQEPQPEPISALERRANAYLNRVRQNKLDKYDNVDWDNVGKSDFSGMEFDKVYHNHAKPLTDFQKLHFVAEISEEEKQKHMDSLAKSREISNEEMARKVREYMGLK